MKRRSAFTLIEALVAAMLLLTLLAVLWPAVRTMMASEAQLAAYTGSATLVGAFRERLSWDLALASPGELAGQPGSGVREDGTGLDLPVADAAAPGGVRVVAWRFDASRNVITRDGQPLQLDGLDWAYFGVVPEHPEALEVHLRGAGPRGSPVRLTLQLRPASSGLMGWKTARGVRG